MAGAVQGSAITAATRTKELRQMSILHEESWRGVATGGCWASSRTPRKWTGNGDPILLGNCVGRQRQPGPRQAGRQALTSSPCSPCSPCFRAVTSKQQHPAFAVCSPWPCRRHLLHRKSNPALALLYLGAGCMGRTHGNSHVIVVCSGNNGEQTLKRCFPKCGSHSMSITCG